MGILDQEAVAGFLRMCDDGWLQGWHERNGGNLTCRLLPGEVAMFARHGVRNVVSLQPFGCIANHIVSKGVEKRIRGLYPQMNLLSLDFDGSVSDVNIMNRLLLFVNNLEN